jgi:hypothetical protein
MFVLATMAAVSVSGPVKIRNMSHGGALIEGGPLPPIGEHLSLRRGELAISGRVVWRQDGRAGMAFDHEVEVGDWLPAGAPRQHQVDQTFQELKTARQPTGLSAVTPIETSPVGKLEVLHVADALDGLADALAEDRAVVAVYAAKLQSLDLASQLLRRFAASLAPLPPGHAEGMATPAARPF